MQFYKLFFLTLLLIGIVAGQAPVVIDSVILNKPVLKGDPFIIWDASIIDDSLCLDISYIGGNKSHVFRLFAFNRKFENKNFYMDLILSHRANADRHQSVISTTLRFDLSPLKRKHSLSNDSIHLNLYKLSVLNRVQMLTYNF
jgi:hypothetical protein